MKSGMSLYEKILEVEELKKRDKKKNSVGYKYATDQIVDIEENIDILTENNEY